MLAAAPLPPFDQAQLDRRFLAEHDRLLQAEAFPTYMAWAQAVGVPPAAFPKLPRAAATPA